MLLLLLSVVGLQFFDGDDEADANVKDITIDNFSVSVWGKDLKEYLS